VFDTFSQLSEADQRRSSDRPYDNGYFLDLVQQVGRLAAQVGESRRAHAGQEADSAETDEMDCSPYVPLIDPCLIPFSHSNRDDEVTLEGGLSQTGRPAELVRWKNGIGQSLRTNERYEQQPGIKRQRSSESLDNDAERSMARRKKNAEPKILRLQCSDPACQKVFGRKCDLAKHEKTHSRPFKCPETTCKYHDQGLPTEKELDRHRNDKHSANPHYYHCQFCPFKTKRESNCKQHMEKKHDWTYDRAKGSSKSMNTPQRTPQTPSISTPSVSTEWGNNSTHGSDISSNMTPYTPLRDESNTNPYQVSLFPPNAPLQSEVQPPGSPHFDFNSSFVPHCLPPTTDSMDFSPASGYDVSFLNTAFTPTHPSGYAFDVGPSNPLHIDIDYERNSSSDLTTPDNHPFLHHSRNPSISEATPITPEDGLFHAMQQAVPPVQNAMSQNYSNIAGLPGDDFSLFGSSGDPTMVPLAADTPCEPVDLFGGMDAEFTDSQFGHYINI
jgi:hypothetical protein